MMHSDLQKMMEVMYPPSDFGVEELEIENSEGMTKAELLYIQTTQFAVHSAG